MCEKFRPAFEKIRPTGDRVLIKRAAVEEKTKSGIIVPETVKETERAQEGTVVAVGSGRRDQNGTRVPMEVQIGDCVYFGKYSGTEAGKDAGGSDYLIIREDEVLGVIEK